MAIFGKNEPKNDFVNDMVSEPANIDRGSDTVSMISQGATIVGNINISCNLHIDGSINGDIVSKATVLIDTHGVVEGSIVADRVSISGKFKGSIDAAMIELLAGSNVSGDIVAERLKMEEGATFEGTSKRRKSTVSTTTSFTAAPSLDVDSMSSDDMDDSMN